MRRCLRSRFALCVTSVCLLIALNTFKAGQHAKDAIVVDNRSKSIRERLDTFHNRDVFPPKKRKNPSFATDFQAVTSDFSLLMYSAYIDISTNYVRVIGVIRKDIQEVYCVLYYNSSKTYKTVTGFIQLLPEDHKVSHSAVHILCPIQSSQTPDEVTLTVPNTSADATSKYTPISKVSSRVQEHKYTTCVSPLHSHYDNMNQLIEWIEMNLLLGADNMIFYVCDVSDDVMSVLRYYELFGLITIYAWTLPDMFTDLNDKQLHYFGQLAALNDCVYKTKVISEYIVAFDLDEVIIPQLKNDFTWSDMLAEIPGKSVYVLRCNFFNQIHNCDNIPSCRNDLSISSYVLKDNIVLPAKKRSKYIARPADVIITGVHYVWNTTTGSEFVVVNPEVGLLHHYRQDKKNYTHEKIRKSQSHVASKYISTLKRRTKLVKKHLQPYLYDDVYVTIKLV